MQLARLRCKTTWVRIGALYAFETAYSTRDGGVREMTWHRLIPLSGNSMFFDAGTGRIYLIQGEAGDFRLAQDAFGGPRELGYQSTARSQQEALNDLLQQYATDLERTSGMDPDCRGVRK